MKQREVLKCQLDQKVPVIMDVFTGQMIGKVLNSYQEANIHIISVPVNMTKYYQPLDLTVNGYAKRVLKSKFNEWYLSQVRAYLDNGVSIDDIEVGLQLSKTKPIHGLPCTSLQILRQHIPPRDFQMEKGHSVSPHKVWRDLFLKAFHDRLENWRHF